jgi:hypothetical protein
MSYKVKKLVIGKGRTVSHEQNGEWVKEYYELEIEIPEENELVIAKENAEGLLNEWLGIAKETPKQKWNWNPDKIKWEKAQGFKGEFERSEDLNNLEFKELLKDLAQHNGKLTRDSYFYWVFKNGSTIGRKKRKG